VILGQPSSSFAWAVTEYPGPGEWITCPFDFSA
jgi:hypothetical protein